MKTCLQCNNDTPRFWKGLCRNCYSRNRRAENYDKIREAERRCHERNKEKRNAYTRRWNKEHQDLIANTIAEKRWKIDAIKSATPCVDCGNKFPPECMDFDHLPGHTKLFSVSKLAVDNYSWAKIEEEMAKCEIVCSNCHRTRTKIRSSGFNRVCNEAQ
jgi:hypothetical protein